jgi:NADH-quinone oxidoreductase subunit C
MPTSAATFQAALLARFPELIVRPCGTDVQVAVNVPAEKLFEFASELRDGEGFEVLADLAGCDWGTGIRQRFGVVYHFQRPSTRETLRAVCNASDDDVPVLPSLVSLYPSANWFEREAFDLFGIRFDGHPALTRLLMPEDYVGHPLRKDFPLAGE